MTEKRSEEPIPLHDEESVGLRLRVRTLEGRLQTLNVIFNAINDGVLVQDPDTGRFVDANDKTTEILGWSKEELRNLTLLDLSQDERSKADALLRQHMALTGAGIPQLFEWAARHKSGETIWIEVNLRSARIIGKTRFLATIRDISKRRRIDEERRALETQVRNTQKLESLGVLAGGIAHDFNNFLTAILGNAELALVKLPPDSPIRANLEQIEKVAMRSSELCRQMLAYSGRGHFAVEPLDLSTVAKDMLGMLELSTSKKAHLHSNLSKDLPLVQADKAQVQQVILNLVTNASEAIGERPGVISLVTSHAWHDRDLLAGTCLDEGLPEGVYVVLEVRDTGCGMSEDVLTRIWDPFFSTKFTGRGLGLPSLMGIVRGHKGTIKVESQEGKGTSFKVLFPAFSAVVASPPTPQIPTWRGSGLALLVDDEETVRQVGKVILEHLGFTVLLANDGQEALRILREQRGAISFVILDYSMPGMDPLEVFLEMRELRPSLQVILSSGYDEQEVRRGFQALPIAGFIPKPYTLEAMVAHLRAALHS